MKFKKFAIGLAIFILTIIFIVFVNKALNTEPTNSSCYNNYYYGNLDYSSSYYQDCQDNYNNQLKQYQEKAFATVVILSILAIIAGVLVRSVAPISWGLVSGGLVMVLYVFLANFDAIGKPYRAIVSGVALIALIWLAYARLGDKEKLKNEVPPVKLIR